MIGAQRPGTDQQMLLSQVVLGQGQLQRLIPRRAFQAREEHLADRRVQRGGQPGVKSLHSRKGVGVAQRRKLRLRVSLGHIGQNGHVLGDDALFSRHRRRRTCRIDGQIFRGALLALFQVDLLEFVVGARLLQSDVRGHGAGAG
ncbi:hypothetical protein D3C80_1427860 [compost metagenome]